MTNDQPPAIPSADRQFHLGAVAMTCLVVFGVVLPVVALVLELLTRLCAGILFDPVPTVYHGALIASVPLANLWGIVALRRQRADYLGLFGLVNGFSIGIAAFYALLFLPFSPFAAFLVMFGGLGLLPLAPLSSMISALIIRRLLKRMLLVPEIGQGRTVPRWWPGVVLALAAMTALEIPKTVTFIGLQMSAADEPELRERGLNLLRRAGSRDVLLRTCYIRQGLMNDPLGFLITELGRPVTDEQARLIYYRVTGTPFNSVKAPRLRAARGGTFFEDWDPDAGSEVVSGRIRNLALHESRQDAIVEAESASAYTEWTMVFKNTSPRQQEARAIVLLPPGGVVSRLTLWIDGEEREAAFGGRSQVKEAYRKVVQRRRDPVLVTTCGPDRVLVQCFPVPPSGGSMKIRLGITSPLDLDALDLGLLRLPYFIESNFNLPETGTHSVWIESEGKLAAPAGMEGWVADQTPGKGFALRGSFQTSMLDMPLAVKVARPGAASECHAVDKRGPVPQAIRQVIREKPVEMPGRIVVVIDGSRKMGEYRGALESIVAALPEGCEFAALLAADEVRELVPLQPLTAPALERFAGQVKAARLAYGCDNVRALANAWDAAGGATNSAILWLHAAQPVDFGGLEQLRQKWERRSGNPVLLCAQFGPGPNVVVQGLDKISAVRSIVRSGDTAEDVRRALALWAGKGRAYRIERNAEGQTALPPGASASDHVARLWALDEVRRLSASGLDADRTRSLEMARLYQLVTPVSGAVVLETQQQYREADLEPVSSQSVPTIPEPGTWLLLAAGSLVLLVFYRWRYRAAHVRGR